MHIPDAFLSPVTEVAAYAVMAPVWWLAVKKTRKSLTSRQTPLLSVCAAFCFAIQMFNIPALGGTTAHPVGTALVAVLLGPWAAILAMTLTLAVQALVFGDGGVLSLAANAWSMAVVPAFVGYAAFQAVKLCFGHSARVSASGAALAAYLATVVASLSASLILGAQPFFFHDSAGHALYFPFHWSVTVPAMVTTHLLVAGPAEAIVTAFAFAFLRKNFPEFDGSTAPSGRSLSRKSWVTALSVAVLTPIGLIATGSAWGEWDNGDIQRMIGYLPRGVESAQALVSPPLVDYSLPGVNAPALQALAYVFCACLGMATVALAIRGVASQKQVPDQPVGRPETASGKMPEWMTRQNKPSDTKLRRSRHWFDSMASTLQDKVHKMYALSEPRSGAGFLQSIPFAPKAIGFLTLLVAISTAHGMATIGVAFLVALTAVLASRISLRPILARAGIALTFFGPVVLISMLFAPEAQGPERVLLLLVRLFVGIFVTSVWTSSTSLDEMTEGMRRSRIPLGFVDAFSLTCRYFFVLVEILAEMVSARKSRQAGALQASQIKSYAGAGTAILFAKSMQLVEEVHMAMRSRSPGLTPEPDAMSVLPTKKKWTIASLACLAAVLIGSVTHVI